LHATSEHWPDVQTGSVFAQPMSGHATPLVQVERKLATSALKRAASFFAIAFVAHPPQHASLPKYAGTQSLATLQSFA
jgi:hypothetical protein